MVLRCNHPVEKDGLCRQHLQEQEYQHRQFEKMMANATRHWQSIGVHGKGVRCGGCDVMVLDGQEHPWNVPHAQEASWWATHPNAPHRSKENKT